MPLAPIHFVHKPDHKGSRCGDKRSQEEEGQVFVASHHLVPIAVESLRVFNILYSINIYTFVYNTQS